MKIAVTGLNNVDNPGPGVPVIRGIRDSKMENLKIIGLIYDMLDPGAYMPEVADKNYLVPYPSGGIDALFERIKFINENENIDVIIPTLDAELYAFAKLEPKLNSIGIKTFLPDADQLNIRSKDKLFKFCEDNNILAPKNILASNFNDLYKIPTSFNYPVVIKGIFYDAYVVNNFDEAVSAFHKISNKWGLPIIVQQFLRGEEYNVTALGDGTGKTVGAVPMKKMSITDKGKGWAGVTIDEQEIINISKNIIEKLEWKGGAEFEFIKEAETGKFYLLEINPRFPAWVYLAVGAGQNLPFANVQLALGNDVETFEKYDVGKIFIRYSWDLITDIKQFENMTVKGELSHE